MTHDGDRAGKQGRPVRRPKRYGLRSLGYLTLALVSIIASNLLYSAGNDDFVLLTFAGLVVGIVGALVTTVRGLRSAGWLPKR